MKISKILTLSLAALALVGCKNHEKFAFDDNQKWNTASGVTVSLAETSMSVFENQGRFTVPVTVTGDPNGYVQLTVELIEVGEKPAMANVHYNATSKVINIDPETKSGVIEILTVDMEENVDNHTFEIKAVSAKGATLAGNIVTLVEIKAKAGSPAYADLNGKYTMTGIGSESELLDTEFFMDVELVANDPEERIVTVVGFDLPLEFVYEVTNPKTNYRQLVVKNGTNAGTYGQYDLFWGDSSASKSGNMVMGVWAGDNSSVSFGDDDSAFYIWGELNGSVVGYLTAYGKFTLKKQ
ncbi:MAG: hypothetical protein HUK14_11465 [Muribaculaceae bacterium]|nr:hypothetical protein [Muribaculaceae bacterium]